MAYNYIRATTKLGAVNIFFVAKDQIRVSTHPESGHSPQNTQLIYRTVPYRASQSFAFNKEKQEFEAITYDRSGNNMVFVSDPSIAGNKYFKLRVLEASRLDRPFDKEPTDAAKETLFEAMSSAVAEWFEGNKEMIFREMAERAKNEKILHVHHLHKVIKEKNEELRKIELELFEAQKELNEL